MCSAIHVRWQCGNARIRRLRAVTAVPLLLPASCAAIDWYLLPAGPTESGFAAVGPCWDSRMDTVPLHRPCSAYYVGSANKDNIRPTDAGKLKIVWLVTSCCQCCQSLSDANAVHPPHNTESCICPVGMRWWSALWLNTFTALFPFLSPPPLRAPWLAVITGAVWSNVNYDQLKKVARSRLPSVGFRSWSRFLAVSLQVMWVINPALLIYFPQGLQLPPLPLRGLLPILLLGEQRHNGCEQFA